MNFSKRSCGWILSLCAKQKLKLLLPVSYLTLLKGQIIKILGIIVACILTIMDMINYNNLFLRLFYNFFNVCVAFDIESWIKRFKRTWNIYILILKNKINCNWIASS